MRGHAREQTGLTMDKPPLGAWVSVSFARLDSLSCIHNAGLLRYLLCRCNSSEKSSPQVLAEMIWLIRSSRASGSVIAKSSRVMCEESLGRQWTYSFLLCFSVEVCKGVSTRRIYIMSLPHGSWILWPIRYREQSIYWVRIGSACPQDLQKCRRDARDVHESDTVADLRDDHYVSAATAHLLMQLGGP